MDISSSFPSGGSSSTPVEECPWSFPMTEVAQKNASAMDQERAGKSSTVDSMSMIIGPAPTNKTDHLLSAEPAIAAGSHAMVLRVNVPPGDAGSGPHRHSGPVFGYVTEGEIWF